MTSRSTQEIRPSNPKPEHIPLGSGMLDRAKKALMGRKSKIDEAADGPAENPAPKKEKKNGY